ncbi:MAG: hypothetical protein IKU16_09590 [Muribaculaceae bacterium]|nr:hypothetical protein [Muribaculaceae bacterium]MBR4887504.1 hypothetical protein [Muribaculaceae bacterium]
MERDIKFRGRTRRGQWVVGNLIKVKGRRETFIGESFTPTASQAHIVEPGTIGQYTGLKDKNGTEIYEGDILRSEDYPFSDNEVKDNYYAVVDWSYDSASFYMTTIKNPRSSVRGASAGNCELMDVEEMEAFEVIGNIHDNQELFRCDKYAN